MSDQAAVLATYVRLQTMADGGVRIVLDLQCSLAEVAALGLMPGTPFGIARISGESSLPRENNTDIIEVDCPHTKPGPLCILACRWCKDPEFWSFVQCHGLYVCQSEFSAKTWILEQCGVSSRKLLDEDKYASHRFHALVRDPFMAWKA